MTSRRQLTAVCAALLALPGCGSTPEPGRMPVTSDTTLEVNGTHLFVHREGAGPPVLVVHGGPLLDHGYLAGPLRPLAREYELVYQDQRLSGRSTGTVDSGSVRLDTMVADSFRREFHDPALADELVFHIPDDYQARSRQLGRMMPDLTDYDLREDLADLDVPTLLVYGAREVGARIGRDALVAAIPRTTAEAIADAGHFPFIERPGEFTRVVRGFLHDVETGAT
ncbi:MAG: alpha/beta fold hydrolase, partial [Gemmatimonadota bacterium]